MFESLLATLAGNTSLSADQIAFIEALFVPRAFKKGQFFQRAGDVTTHGGFVVRGCFRTYVIDTTGKEGIVHFSPEGGWIGDLQSATTGTPTQYFVDAIEPSDVLLIDLPSFEKLLDAIPEVARSFRLGLQRAQAAGRRRIAFSLYSSAEELGRLRPDAVITWGPDGGTGHPDHRLVSSIVTQLLRAGAPGVPERLFHMNLPVAVLRAMNPQRGEPPLLVPEAKYFTVQVPFAPEDLAAARRAMACHRTQFTEETVQRVFPVMVQVWNGVIPLASPFSRDGAGTDVFR